MDLSLDETQALLRDAVRSYLAAELPFDRIRALEREGRADDVLWKALVAQGWLGAALPEAWGGAGGSLVDAGLILEELARRAAIVPAAETLAALLALAGAQSGADAAALALDVLAGSSLVVPALLEQGGAHGRVALDASQDGTLSGEKHFVDYAQGASHHLVAARAGASPALFLVRTEAGVTSRPLRTIGRTPAAHVRYERARATRIAGADAVAALWRLGRLFAAVQCIGSAQQALDATVAYASVRVQFGRAIGSFQAVKHHMANMAMRLEAARFLVYEALHAASRGKADDRQVALAKASASRCVSFVTLLAHQIHGGNGVIEENDLYFFTLRGKDRSLAWGSFEECLAETSAGVDAERSWT
jgi:alkylation response protein AidB-like acyl-CoA dehydrogenase